MLRLKNKPRAVIVVYDDDESIASKAATTLTQRGYDNVFMLSGELFLKMFSKFDKLTFKVGSGLPAESFLKVWSHRVNLAAKGWRKERLLFLRDCWRKISWQVRT